MKRLLLCSGIDGKTESLKRLCQWACDRKPEAILFAGGILSPEREMAPRTTPWGITREDGRFVMEVCKALGGLGVNSFVIPEPSFEPLDEFCRLAMAGEESFPNVHVVHATLVEEGDLAVTGLGVAIAEESLMRADSYSRTRALYFLRALRRSDKPRKVLLLPEPPPGVLGGPEGNASSLATSLTACDPACASWQDGRSGVACRGLPAPWWSTQAA